MRNLIHIKGRATIVFDIIRRLAELHPAMTLKELNIKLGE